MGQAAPRAGMIRALTPADLPAFRDHMLRLDAETRCSRFAMGATDPFVHRYAETALALGAVIFAYFEEGALRAVGELRPVSGREAEAAFDVELGWRGRGIGTALFAHVIEAARERRIHRLYMSCLARNKAMQALCRKFEAELVFESPEVLTIADRPESDRDAASFATAILTLKSRWFALPSR